MSQCETPRRRESRYSEYSASAAMPVEARPVSPALHSRTSSAGSNASDGSIARSWKVVTIGDTAVGKTTAIISATTGRVPESEPQATIGVSWVPSMIRGIQMQLWDTAGQPNHRSITKQALQGAHYILYVFAIDSMRSFEQITTWRDTVQSEFDSATVDQIPAALIGNKCDLEAQRKVPVEMAQELARQQGWLYFETSAKSVEKMQRCMRVIGEDIEKRQNELGGMPKPMQFANKRSKAPTTITQPIARKPDPPSIGQRICASLFCCCHRGADDESEPLVREGR